MDVPADGVPFQDTGTGHDADENADGVKFQDAESGYDADGISGGVAFPDTDAVFENDGNACGEALPDMETVSAADGDSEGTAPCAAHRLRMPVPAFLSTVRRSRTVTRRALVPGAAPRLRMPVPAVMRAVRRSRTISGEFAEFLRPSCGFQGSWMRPGSAPFRADRAKCRPVGRLAPSLRWPPRCTMMAAENRPSRAIPSGSLPGRLVSRSVGPGIRGLPPGPRH